MTSDKDRIEKVVRTIADARAMGLTVLPPDINESDTDFKVVYTNPGGDKRVRPRDRVRDKFGPQIRFGLGAVRGVGGGALDAVFEARQAGGPFKDLFDFAERIDAKRMNKGVLEALVQCGAFDTTLSSQGITRARAFGSIDLALERSRSASRDRERGQTSLFGLFDAAPQPTGAKAQSTGDYVVCETWDQKEMLVRERQSLGFYVSGHPLDRYLKGPGAFARFELAAAADCATMKGKIAFFELEDLTGRVNVKVRGKEIETFAHLLTGGEPLVIQGKVSFPRRDEDAPEGEEPDREPTIFLNDVKSLSAVVKEDTKALALRIDAKKARVEDLRAMRDLFVRTPGETRVDVQLTLETGAEAFLGLSREYRVEVGDALLAGLERLFGSQVAELR